MLCRLFCMALLWAVISNVHAQPVADSTGLNHYFRAVKWRSIGPFRGGRSNCATGVPSDPMVYYQGTTGGGVWKTDDMGMTWKNISDGYFKTGSVGAIAVADSDPNIVYVGMGEHAIRGVMTHSGDGMYKSSDAGKTWKRTGLDLTQHIARIIVHPKDPNVVYVAAQGALYGNSKDRGIYKSIDGGVTWKKVLYVNEMTGCAEISMDMSNPSILYAAMWEHGRKPWQVISGGPGSGLYKSTDGGETWTLLKSGLPKELGKMAIAVCRTNPEKVYALIESDSETEKGGLYVSTNAGASWSQVSDDNHIIQRAWYYIELFVDPKNENILYVMSAPMMKSIDGGKTWEDVSNTHGDYHNLWINPNNPDNMIVSDDGGSAITFNSGKTWSSQRNQPTAQMYRINVDNLFPYNIYGGQQDNSTVRITSREPGRRGIYAENWTFSAGGESAFLAFNPDDPRLVMGGSYQGTIDVLNTDAKGSTNIMAAPIQYMSREAKDMKYRFNWNAPIIWSKHEPGVFYHGSQYLLRTDDLGKTWKEVSPDLTRNDKAKQGKPGVPYTNEAVGAENYCTLAYVLESPHEKGVIYTASDDGLLHLTKDNGKSWQNVTPSGLQECLINAIEVSPFDKATVYIATTRFKFNDHTPGLYKSADYGKTWTSINTGIPYGAFTRVVREDPERKNLLYAGTETGVYLSWNGGQQWQSFQLNLPITPVTDLKVHQGNLIASTSGRSFWILDDLSVIRQYEKDSAFQVFTPTPAYLINGSSELDGNDSDFSGAAPYIGVNPSTGVVFYYQLPTLSDSVELIMEITDESGKLVRKFSSKSDSNYKKYDGGPPSEPVLSKNKGLNRFVWNMRHTTMPGVPNVYMEVSYRGHKVPPGRYKVTLKTAANSSHTDAVVLANPKYPVTEEEYTAYTAFMSGMEEALTDMHNTTNTLYEKRLQLESLLTTLTDARYKSLAEEGKQLVDKMKAWDAAMVQRKSKVYDDAENYLMGFTANYLFLINQAESEIPMVTQPAVDLQKEMGLQWAAFKNTSTEILQKDLPAFNKKCWEAGIGALWK